MRLGFLILLQYNCRSFYVFEEEEIICQFARVREEIYLCLSRHSRSSDLIHIAKHHPLEYYAYSGREMMEYFKIHILSFFIFSCSLSKNQIGDEGCKYLADALKCNTSLAKLG